MIAIEVVSFDWNCPKHITPRFTAAQINLVIGSRRRRIAELEAELASRPAGEETCMSSSERENRSTGNRKPNTGQPANWRPVRLPV